jgi:hypothetical protein
MRGWIEAMGQVVTDIAVWALDLIEGAWKKAIAPKDE